MLSSLAGILPGVGMTLITRRRLIGSGFAAAGRVAAPAVLRADDPMVAKGVYWKRVPCQKDHVYSKHLVPDRWFLELYALPDQSWCVTYPPESGNAGTLAAAPFGNGDTKSVRPETNGAAGCVVVSKDLSDGAIPAQNAPQDGARSLLPRPRNHGWNWRTRPDIHEEP